MVNDMAVIGNFACRLCGRIISMAYGGLFSNSAPHPDECICAHCIESQKILMKALEKEQKGGE